MENEYENRLGILDNHLEQFKRLEIDRPEVAERLGFAGYVHMVTLEFYGNERHEQLEEIARYARAIKNR